MPAHVHSIFMGNVDVPTQNNQPVKMAMGTYEFGANLVSSKVCYTLWSERGAKQEVDEEVVSMPKCRLCEAASLDWRMRAIIVSRGKPRQVNVQCCTQ